MKKRKRLRDKDLPTATEMGSVEQDIVSAAMSYSAARAKGIKEKDLEKWVPIATLEVEFRELLFQHCRRLRKLLKKLARAAKKRRGK